MLAEKMQQHGTTAWLINTGWTGGGWVLAEGARSWLVCSQVPGTDEQTCFVQSWSNAVNQSWRCCSICIHAEKLTRHLYCLYALSYGVGSRMSLKHTRAIVDAIHR
jgi:hypothetical protein